MEFDLDDYATQIGEALAVVLFRTKELVAELREAQAKLAAIEDSQSHP